MPLFTPLQLFKLIELAKKDRIAPLYLFIGPHEITLEKAKDLYKILLEKGCLLEVYDLREKEQKNAFLNLKGFQKGLFGVRTIYSIIAGEEIPPNKIEEILKSLKEENKLFSWFILFAKLDETHLLYQKALAEGAIIPFNLKKKEDLLESDMLLTLKEYQLTMDKKSANLFISLVGDNYLYFKQELEKLIFYALEDKIITEEHIKEITLPLEEKALYILGDAIFNQGPQRVLNLIVNFLDAKKDPREILAYLYNFFKKLLLLKEFLRDHPELQDEESYTFFSKKWQELKENPLKELPKTLAEAHPYTIFLMKKYLKKINSLERVIYFLFEAEWELKREFKPPLKVFFNLIFNLWSSFNPSPPQIK
ncbi:MAG: DNA polymerase III subunit delta [Caldimicrobium sp.]